MMSVARKQLKTNIHIGLKLNRVQLESLFLCCESKILRDEDFKLLGKLKYQAVEKVLKSLCYKAVPALLISNGTTVTMEITINMHEPRK